MEFKSNGTYACYTGNTVTLNGTYTFDETDSTLTVEDNGCFDIAGKYKVHLSANTDSLRFTPVNMIALQEKQVYRALY